jgi:hypothetical protein
MIKGGLLPVGRIVAGFTNYGDTGSHMIGILCSCKNRSMAGIAIFRSSGITTGMAFGAGNSLVCSCQWESREQMVEGGIHPVIKTVADFTVQWKGLILMILRVIKLNLVTGNTIRFGIKYGSFMAIRALNHLSVTARQFITGCGMIKGRWFPGSRGMAGLALVGNTGGSMKRCLCSIEFSLVTGVAVCKSSGKTRGMTSIAVGFYMGPGQRKVGFCVIESSLLITFWMTGKAGNAVILVTIRLFMFIIHPGFGVLMTIQTGENSIITGLVMTFGTIIPPVRMLSRIYREKAAIMFSKFCRFPFRASRMAILAAGRQIDLLMVRGSRRIKGICMTRKTIGRNFCVFSGYMAKAAAYGMAVGQGEKAMINIAGVPACRAGLMALQAIG